MTLKPVLCLGSLKVIENDTIRQIVGLPIPISLRFDIGLHLSLIPKNTATLKSWTGVIQGHRTIRHPAEFPRVL